MRHQFTSSSHRAGPGGFTLVELLIVLVLVAAAAALVVPSTVRAFANLQLRQDAVRMASLFRQARARALYEARTYQVVFAPEQKQLFLVREDGRPAGRIALTTGVSLRAQRGNGIWAAEFEPVHFFPDGTCEPAQLELGRAGISPVGLELEAITGNIKMTRVTPQ